MSGTNHPWCRDVRRDEAVRAAEDAAAAERTPLPDHRDLPQAVADLRERVARLEDAIYRAGQFAAPEAQKGPNFTERESGLRTERVTLEIKHFDDNDCDSVRHWNWSEMMSEQGLGINESVRVVEDADAASDEVIAHGVTLNALAEARESLAAANRGIDRLTAERDAAIRERDAARARVAELERAYASECDARAQAQRELSDLADAIRNRESGEECDHSYAAQCKEAAAARDRADRMIPAPAANAGGEARQEPVLHGVLWADRARIESHDVRDDCEQAARLAGTDGTVVPLYAAPQRPRGWLNSEERRTLANFVTGLRAAAAAPFHDEAVRSSLTKQANDVEALLAREMPPRVKVPSQPAEFTLRAWNLCVSRWIAAIRAAGGEVEE